MSKSKSKNTDKRCGICKWIYQARNSAACCNPKQTDKQLKDYTYHCFSCDLFEKGEQLTESQMKELGYKLMDNGIFKYYGKE